MTITVDNPYTGEAAETCSVSFAAQQSMAETGISGQQTEAQFNKSQLLGEWGVVKGKAASGQIPAGTKLFRATTPTGMSHVVTWNGNSFGWRTYGSGGNLTNEVKGKTAKQIHKLFFAEGALVYGWRYTMIGQRQPKPEPTVPMAWAAIKKAAADGSLHPGTHLIRFDDNVGNIKGYTLYYKGGGEYGYITHYVTGPDIDNPHISYDEEKVQSYFINPHSTFDGEKVLWKGKGDDKPPAAAPTPSPAVSPGSTSAGSMTDEDVASLFVLTKDKLATEKGLNIKGANPALDQEVYAAIGKATGYTPAEAKAKVDSYKANGNKLSALKKKVLKKGPANEIPTVVVPAGVQKVTSVAQANKLLEEVVGNDDRAKFMRNALKGPEEFGLANSKTFITRDDQGKLTGAMTMVHHPDDEGLEPYYLIDYLGATKGSGAGTDLVRQAVKQAHDEGVNVYAEPTPDSEGFWLHIGFKYDPADEGVDFVGVSTDKQKDWLDGKADTVPTEATQAVADKVAEEVVAAVEDKPKLYSDADVAAQYIIAKDAIVAASNGKWTLYTKSDELDLEIAIQVGLKTGLNPTQQKQAVANYLSTGKKLSQLKKSLVKDGKLTPQADTLKKTKAAKSAEANLADIAQKADEGFLGDTPEETPSAPFQFSPKPDDLTFTGQTLGTHAAQVWKGADGAKWLFKPQEAFLTELDVAAATLAKKLGHPTADVYKMTLNGKQGSIQRMFDGGQAFPSLVTVNNATDHFTPVKTLALQKEQALDWLLSQHDSHYKNFVLDEHGNMIGIDKGQSFKFFGNDQLSATYHPNPQEQPPLYNVMWKAFKEGKAVPINNPYDTGELADFIVEIEGLPDKEFKDIFRPYAEAAKAKGILAPGTSYANDVEGFLEKLVERKYALGQSFDKLYQDNKPGISAQTAPPPLDLPSMPTVADVTAASADQDNLGAGRINHVSETHQSQFYTLFKGQLTGKYLKDSPQSVYQNILVTIDKAKNAHSGTPLANLTPLQALRIIDAHGAVKFNATNDKLFEKKVVEWLGTPEGKTSALAAHAAAQAAKEAVEKAEALRANQPPLPDDSALFRVIQVQEAFSLQGQWHANNPWTHNQQDYLRYYTSNSGYTEMNGALRGKRSMTPSIRERVGHADDGMRPSTEPILLHRGTGFDQFPPGIDRDTVWSLPGRKLDDQGFMSTSVGGRAAFSSKPVIMEIECPMGTPMAFVKGISHYPNESEILLKSGTNYRVLRVEEHGHQIIVRCRVELS